jgi:hypothetical protein
MALSMKERGAKGGSATAANRTPEERREAARRAYLSGAVNAVAAAVAANAPELSAEQLARLRQVLGSAA